MSCFLSSPLLQFPPKVIFFDLDEAIFGTREYYFLHPTIIGNVIHGPMPRPDAKHRPTAASSSPFPPPNAAFAFPAFPLPFALLLAPLCDRRNYWQHCHGVFSTLFALPRGTINASPRHDRDRM